MSEIEDLLLAAAAKIAAMSPTEREAMYRAQRDAYVCAEMRWPKPRFKMIDGVKVYASYEDYCNGRR